MVTIPPTFGLLRILTTTPPQPTGAANLVKPVTPETSSQATHARNTGELPPGTKFQARVVAQGENRLHTLQLPDGRQLQTQAQRQLPVGTQVTLQALPQGQAQILAIALPAGTMMQQLITKYAGKWEALTEAIKDLRTTNPALADRVSGALPRPGGNFLAALSAFSSAAQQQKLQGLLPVPGGAIGALEGLLTDDMAELTQLIRSPGANDWRALFFPYQQEAHQDPQQGAFYWRQQDEGENSSSTRFVVELDLTSWGPVQVDGLLRQQRLRVILRLQEAIDAEFMLGLEEVFNEVVQGLDLAGGEIRVETTQRFPVDPLHDILSPAHTANVKV